MKIDNTSASSQRSRILKRLQEGPATTLDLMEINIMRPAARIFELKDKGHDIRKHSMDVVDPWGYKHSKVALYYIPTEMTHVDPEDAA